MLIRLLFLFTVVPAVELYLLLQIGSAIGAFETIWLIIIRRKPDEKYFSGIGHPSR